MKNLDLQIFALSSEVYWKKREEEQLKHYIQQEEEYDKQIQQIYQNMLDSCQNEINAFYGHYASKEGISIADAKKRVAKLDIEAYERKAKRYVEEREFSAEANEEMRLYNLTMKVNRLEMLKANIGLELIAGHDELQKYMESILQGRTEEELARQAGILGKTIKNNSKLAHSIPNASFHNATFSDRVWMYQDLLKSELSNLLQSGLIQGKNPRVLAKELKKRFDVKTSDAERLMRTELARVQTDAQKQSFIRNGFEEYKFIVNGGCCPICEGVAKENNGVYKVAKMMPGKNAPPMHPHCRCSIAAHEDSEEYEAWLDYLDKGGTTEEWNKKKKIKMASKETAKWASKGQKISNEDYKKLMQYARGKGIELSGFKQFDGDIQTVLDLVDDADMVAKHYPEIKKGKRKLTIQLDETLKDADFAVTNGHIVSINANAYRNTKLLSNEYKKAVDEGWFVGGTDYHAIIKHEIGHVVANEYKCDPLQIAMKCSGIKSKIELMEYLESHLSKYSVSYSDGSEIISECFSSVYGSGKPTDFALKFVEKYGNMKP